MKKLFNEIANLVSQGQSFALATVIIRNGSAPRSSGARMLVRPDGSTVGTVGGGSLEAQVEQLARQALQNRRAVVQGFQFSGKDATTMDAICGGQVDVLVEPVEAADPAAALVFTRLEAAISRREKVWLVTELPGEGQAEKTLRRALVYPDGALTGDLPAGLAAETVTDVRRPILLAVEAGKFYIDPIDVAGTAYIFGAGHVSRSLAEFTKAVGFWTVVLDDRPEYACAGRFPTADEIIVLDGFAGALERLEIDRDSYVVIVTRGHLDDHTVLAQALRTPAGYIGMIGSRRKCKLIFDALLADGYTQADIQRVHGPIGLPIDAETPEEIGVSITAEMIRVRAENKTRK